MSLLDITALDDQFLGKPSKHTIKTLAEWQLQRQLNLFVFWRSFYHARYQEFYKVWGDDTITFGHHRNDSANNYYTGCKWHLPKLYPNYTKTLLSNAKLYQNFTYKWDILFLTIYTHGRILLII